VSGKGGFSLVSIYCSEMHSCARSNVTIMSNITEVPGKCKFGVNIVPYLLGNKKVENELFCKRVYFLPLQVLYNILTHRTLKRRKKDIYIRNIKFHYFISAKEHSVCQVYAIYLLGGKRRRVPQLSWKYCTGNFLQ